MNNLTDIFFSNLNIIYRVGGFFYAPVGTDWEVTDDIFGQNIFYFITEGSCTITIDKKTYTGKPGDWFFIPAGTKYSYHNLTDKPFSKYWFHFDLEPNLSEHGLISLEYMQSCQNNSEVKEAFKEFSSLCESKRPADIIKTKSLVLKLLAIYIDLASKEADLFAKRTPKELVSLISFIGSNLNQPLPNDLLSQKLHMQTNHFIRYFKNRLGQTPQRYIMAKRMDLAKKLLLEDELSLSEISEKTGFYDNAHFSKNFRAFYSISPSQYRKYAKGK